MPVLPPLSLPCDLGQVVKLLEPQLPHLENGYEVMIMKHLAQRLAHSNGGSSSQQCDKPRYYQVMAASRSLLWWG